MSAFVERLRAEGEKRYHDRHRYHVLMHEGRLSRGQLQQWVLNRYYYQTRIPIKDALIVSKSEDPAFRRLWLHRIRDHDGDAEGEGGLAMWLRLADGVGLDREEVASCRSVLPGVRTACDSYVELVRTRGLLEAVASSLTEFFAPDIMSKRVAAWEKHYPWVDPAMLAYFRTRVTRARKDAEEAVAYVERHATTPELQDQCVAALIRKTEILWALLDSVYAACVSPKLAPKARLRHDRKEDKTMLLYPEKGLVLNATAADIAKLCTGENTVDGIIEKLSKKYSKDAATVQREVIGLLTSFAERGLILE
ncbi:MAG TPA: pyrroloquinoline-quinone synthase PqqC [Burkholderiales bacterium]